MPICSIESINLKYSHQVYGSQAVETFGDNSSNMSRAAVRLALE